MILRDPNTSFSRKQLLNTIKGKINFDYCADYHVKRSLENLDRSSKDINELINKMEVLISDFSYKQKAI